MKYKWRWLMLFILGLTLLSGCNTALQNEGQTVKENPKMTKADPTPSPKPRDYSKNLEDLRAKFNRDKGKVRLVTLLSPT